MFKHSVTFTLIIVFSMNYPVTTRIRPSAWDINDRKGFGSVRQIYVALNR